MERSGLDCHGPGAGSLGTVARKWGCGLEGKKVECLALCAILWLFCFSPRVVLVRNVKTSTAMAHTGASMLKVQKRST